MALTLEILHTTTPWLSQLEDCWIAEWEVVGSNLGLTNTQGL